jgi:toxin ParE1/3/4
VKALEWRPMALEDRDAIMDHIAEDNVAAALKLDAEFEAHADRACKTPTLYKPGRMKGTREIVVHPNYVMVYQVETAAVVILRVLHAAQQWPAAAV